MQRHEEMEGIEKEEMNETDSNTNKLLPLLPPWQPVAVKTIVVRNPRIIIPTIGHKARQATFCESFDKSPLTPDSAETEIDPLVGARFLVVEEASQFSVAEEPQQRS
jgi:hypothetical protein